MALKPRETVQYSTVNARMFKCVADELDAYCDYLHMNKGEVLQEMIMMYIRGDKDYRYQRSDPGSKNGNGTK